MRRVLCAVAVLALVGCGGGGGGGAAGTARALPGSTTPGSTTPGTTTPATQGSTVKTPAQLVLLSGDGQTGTAALPLADPFVVAVRDAAGSPVAGAAVDFTVTLGGGTLSAASVVTDVQGQARATLALGKTVGANEVTASVPGLASIIFHATGAAGPASRLAIVSGNQQTGVVGTALPAPLVVALSDAGGNPVAGTTVAFAVVSGGGSLSVSSATTDAGGQASTVLTLGATSGAARVSATATGLAGSVTFDAGATTRPAARLELTSGDKQTAIAGSALAKPIVLTVRDSAGTPVSGFMVTLAVTGGGGALGAKSVATDAQGQATVTWTLGTLAGPNGASAVATGLTGSPVALTATGIAGPASQLALVSGDNQTGVAGTRLPNPLVVAARDSNGNAVSGATVTFAVKAGGGTLSATSVATDAQGKASTLLTLGATAGANTVTASVAGVATPVTFTEGGTAAPAAKIALASGDSQTGVAGAALGKPFVVLVTDAGGAPVPAFVVAFTVASGGGALSATSVATDAQGQAATTLTLGKVAGGNTVTATAAGLTGSPVTFTASGSPGAAARVVVTSGDAQTGVVGTALPAPLVVTVTDANANVVAGAPVSFAVASGGGALSATDVKTDAQGKASSVLTLGAAPATIKVTATVAGLTPATFTETAQAAAVALTFAADIQPILKAQCIVCHAAGGVAAFTPLTSYTLVRNGVSSFSSAPLVVPFQPASSVLVAKIQATGTMYVNLGPDNATRDANAKKIADWIAQGALNTAVGAPTALAIVSGDKQTGAAANPLAAPLVVTALDANGNGVAGVAVTFAASAGGGTLNPTSATTNALGQAATMLTVGAGANSVTASASGLTAVTFTATGTTGTFTGGPLAGSTNPLDVAALEGLKAAGIDPVPLSSDGEFLRRVTTILAGRLPSESELAAFLADTALDRRAKVIDGLLASPEFSNHWTADIFAVWVGVAPVVSLYHFNDSVKAEIASDVPISTIVKNIITGTGDEGQAYFYQGNYGFDGRDGLDRLMNIFTGMSSRCARCHDHKLTTPLDDPKWTMDDNYGLYAFVVTRPEEATKRDRLGAPIGAPLQPAFVVDGYASAPAGLPLLSDPLPTRRARLADLLTNSNAFARGTAHRIWTDIATPLLDPNQFLQANLAAVKTPKLLAALTKVWQDQNQTLRGFLRVCMNSKLFQLTSAGTSTAADPFQGRYVLRRQHAEVVDHGASQIVGSPWPGINSTFLYGDWGYPVYYVNNFNPRNDSVTLAQAFTQMNDPNSTNGRVTLGSASVFNDLVTKLTAKTITFADATTRVFRVALSRDPSAAELAAAQTLRAGAPNDAEALADLMVSIAASPEFVMR